MQVALKAFIRVRDVRFTELINRVRASRKLPAQHDDQVLSINRCVFATSSFNRCVFAPLSFNRCVFALLTFNRYVFAPLSFNRCVFGPETWKLPGHDAQILSRPLLESGHDHLGLS